MMYFRHFFLLGSVAAILQAASTSTPRSTARMPVVPLLDSTTTRMPLWFEPNVGQMQASASYLARSGNHTVLLTPSNAWIRLWDRNGSDSVRLRFVGASAAAAVEGVEKLPSVSNYFIGNDRKKWRTNVPHYAKVRFRNVYPGVDVVYYSNRGILEYDFIVSPGADPNRIQLSYEGGGKFSIDDSGNVHVALRGREMVQHRPRIYQEVAGRRVEVAGSYRVKANGIVQFALAKYDRSRPLVIDPVLDYSVYLGGSAYDTAIAITLDSAGNKYLTGSTASSSFVSNSQFQDRLRGATDAYIARFDASGTLRYFTYIGGSHSPVTGPAINTGRAIVVDRSGDIYIAGDTNADDFPVQATNNFSTNRFAGGSADAFVSKIAAAGDRLIYTKYIGGGSDVFVGGGRGCGTGDGPDCLVPGRADEFGSGLAIDPQGFAYLTGFTKSSDFPVVNGFMNRTKSGGESAFVTKVNQAGTDFVYSTVIEGNGKDGGEGIALDTAGNIYITGYTTSTNFPLASAFQTVNRGAAGFEDAFVLKLDPAAQRLIYSTYLGGTGRDLGFRIAVDASNSAYVTGYTLSADFPTRNAAQPNFGGNADAFVTKLSPDGSTLAYSTYLGGSGSDWGFADIAVDASGNAYVAGYTTSTDLRTKNAFQAQFGAGDTHGYVAQLSAAGNDWVFLSYYGGSQHDEIHAMAFDAVRNTISIAGFTSSPNLPSAKNAFVGDQQLGKYDAFLAQISNLGTAPPTILISPQSLTFNVSGGGQPTSQTVSVSSSGIPLQFTVANANPANTWLTVSTSATTTPATVTVTVDPRLVGSAATSGAINIDVVGGSRVTIPVIVGVTSVPAITSISPNTIAVGSGDTTITVSGSGFTGTSTVALNGAAAPTQFVNAGTLTATVARNLLTSASTIAVSVINGGTSSAPVSITVASGVPVITASNVLNGATNLPGPISPGEIISIKGSGLGPSTPAQPTGDQIAAANGYPTLLSGTRVLINGIAAPLTYVSESQVNAIVPYSVTSGQASIQVEYQGRQSAAATVAVTLTSPGIFTASGTGNGQALILNENGTLNSATNPAPKGSAIVFYATGEGLTNPPGVTGSLAPAVAPKPVLQVAVKINGLDAELLYAGGAPGLVEGAMQVNVRVPQGAPSGTVIPLVLQVGGVSSPFIVTMAVQ
jgi:uncharacterized protein (TIGR03437 family)